MGKNKTHAYAASADLAGITKQLLERGNDAYTADEFALVADGLKEIARDERSATQYERFLAAVLYTKWANHPTLKRERYHPPFPDKATN